MSGGRSYSQADLKLLWGRAAARCAFPECRVLCAADATPGDPAAVLGEIAHIIAHSDGGPRSDASLRGEERDRYANLILLCPAHHAHVDKQPNTFTADMLRRWKEEHERWVNERLAREMPEVGFSELEQITRGLLAASSSQVQDLVLTEPAEKLEKNRLGPKVRFTLTMGLSKVHEVRDYVERATPLLGPEFPDRLKAGFLNKYRELHGAGLQGDALFEALRDFAAPPSKRSFNEQAAGLAVLAYLFQACEVFER